MENDIYRTKYIHIDLLGRPITTSVPPDQNAAAVVFNWTTIPASHPPP